LQAALAAVHASAPTYADTDWDEVVSIYDVLGAIWPSPVVALNRAVAVGMAQGPAAGLAAIEVIRGEPELAGYRYLPAARAEFLRRAGRVDEARSEYAAAISLTDNTVEREHMQSRLASLDVSCG
jgi:predicted RNA polymerase sigma factor